MFLIFTCQQGTIVTTGTVLSLLQSASGCCLSLLSKESKRSADVSLAHSNHCIMQVQCRRIKLQLFYALWDVWNNMKSCASVSGFIWLLYVSSTSSWGHHFCKNLRCRCCLQRCGRAWPKLALLYRSSGARHVVQRWLLQRSVMIWVVPLNSVFSHDWGCKCAACNHIQFQTMR